jgi:uncharacterized protein YndB with AHSA1/START domain
MKSKVLTVIIDRSIDEVWEFATNPTNTPKWLDFITKEEVSEWPPRLGSMYRNWQTDGSEGLYEVTAWDPPTLFELTNVKSAYKVEYAFKQISDGQCELRYTESTEAGELSDIFSQASLDHLKTVMEATRT